MSQFNQQQTFASDGLHFQNREISRQFFIKMVKDLPANTWPDPQLIDRWTIAAGQLPSKDRISVIVDLQNELQQQRSLGVSNYTRRILDTNFLIKKLYSQRGEEPPMVQLDYPRSGLQGYWRKTDLSLELYDKDTGFYAGRLCEKNGHIIHATEQEIQDNDPICVPDDDE